MIDVATADPAAPPAPGTAEPCVLTEPVSTDNDDTNVVPTALTHLRDVARHAFRTASGNGCYPPELAVATLTDTTAGLVELAHQFGPYVGDYWPTAERRMAAAETALAEARGHLDAARHHITLIPATDDQPSTSAA